MAFTMTRTRTQTALTKLLTLVANGELAFGEGRLADEPVPGALPVGLARRRAELLASRDALYVTVRQFDRELDSASVGVAEDWLKPYGRGVAARRRYLHRLR